MLGRSVSDPEGVEAAGLTELRGMGLLEMETVFHGGEGAAADGGDVFRCGRDARGAERTAL